MNSAGSWTNANTAAWGSEEKKANPFRRGDPFDIRFRLHNDHFEVRSLLVDRIDLRFQVQVDKLDFYGYRYRVGIDRITHLGIGGAGYLTYVQLGERYNVSTVGNIQILQV